MAIWPPKIGVLYKVPSELFSGLKSSLLAQGFAHNTIEQWSFSWVQKKWRLARRLRCLSFLSSLFIEELHKKLNWSRMKKSPVPLFSFLIKIRPAKLTPLILEATPQSHPLQMLSHPLEFSLILWKNFIITKGSTFKPWQPGVLPRG